MRNLKHIWSLALLFAVSAFMVSCTEDDPIVDVEEGLNVEDGYYFVVEGEDPVAEKALLPELVEGEGFAPTERDGFYGNYVYLTAGDYQLVQVSDREVAATLGGDLGAPEGDDSGYLVATTADGGAALNVSSDGYYKVSYDETLTELVMMQVTSVSLIGSATPNGWGADTELSVSQEASDEGFVFSGADIVMREGEYKIRINNRWTIDRRIDREASEFDPNNGYVAFTNYGGEPSNLVQGGSNIPFDGANEGAYEFTVTLSNDVGAEIASNRTGDAPEITFDPADYSFGILGSVTANGFDADRDMVYKNVDGVPTWMGVVYFGDTPTDGDPRFKIRANDAWDFNLGGTLPADGTEATLAVGGADIAAPAAGAYYIELKTADEGETWTATMVDAGWSLIGAGSPSGSWEQDTFLTAEGFVDGVTTYTFSGEFVGGAYKFRAGGAWNYNLGGALDALALDGSDLSVDAGTYDVVLSFDGSNYTATVQ